MDWYEDEVRQLERATQQQQAPSSPTVFYGSSSIRLWDTLAQDLPSWRAVNRGFGGSTLAACVHFFDRLVPPLKPGSLVVYAGDNDLGDGRPPEDVLGSLRALKAKQQRLGAIPFAFVSIKPSPARFGIIDRIRRANDLIRQELTGHPAVLYIDLFPAMLAADGRPRRELFSEDGLHLSRAGYRLWAELLTPHRNQIVIDSPSDGDTHGIRSGSGAGVPPLV